jgi:hypothetical protein
MKQAGFEAFIAMAITEKPPGHRQMSVCLNRAHKPPRKSNINPLNAELNPICHLLALLEAHHIFHVSRIRVKLFCVYIYKHVDVGCFI